MVRQKRVILLILAAITACIGWMCATQIADEETIFPAGAQVQTWADFTGSSLSKHDAIKMLATLAHDVLLQCLFSRLISIFPQCGRMVFPGLVIMQSVM